MDRQLAAAVVNSFRDSDYARHKDKLRPFSVPSWKRTFHWLDASGLALYFLHRLRAITVEDAIPSSVLTQLARRQADNHDRTASLFKEFMRINAEFRAANLRYVNLKGFSLIPDYCPARSLRYQTDCDFLIARSDAGRCAELLRSLGYGLVANTDYVLEFKTGVSRTPHIRDLYKAGSQRSVELHLCDETRAALHPCLIDRARVVISSGHSFPALSAEDMFLSQTTHLFRHLCSEWTRISWLLEFRYFVLNRKDDGEFWEQIQARAGNDRHAALAIGTVLKLAQKTFGSFRADGLDSWALERLPVSVALWVDRYGDDVVFSDFPGSKLYLLLERAMHGSESTGSVRKRLFPMRTPGPIVAAPSLTSLSERAVARLGSFRYLFFRLRFHLKADLRYFVEARRWKRLGKYTRANQQLVHSADVAANPAD